MPKSPFSPNAFDPRFPYPVETMGGLFDDVKSYVGDAVDSAWGGTLSAFQPKGDPAFSDPDLAQRSYNAAIVRNAISTGEAARVTGAKVGPPKKAAATSTKSVTTPAADPPGGLSYTTLGGAAAVVGAGVAVATGHKNVAMGLGIVGLAALVVGFMGKETITGAGPR